MQNEQCRNFATNRLGIIVTSQFTTVFTATSLCTLFPFIFIPSAKKQCLPEDVVSKAIHSYRDLCDTLAF